MCEPHKELDLAETLAALGFVSGGELMEGVTIYRLRPEQGQAPQTTTKEPNDEHEQA